MTEIEKMSRDEMLERLLKHHDIYVAFNNDPQIHNYTVTQYTLSEIMRDVACGDRTTINFPCYINHKEAFVTISLDNVCLIIWPDEAAKQMHLAMSDSVEDLVDDILDEEADEGEA